MFRGTTVLCVTAIAVLTMVGSAYAGMMDTFSVNFYAYGKGGDAYWGQEAWRETVRLEPDMAAGVGAWNTTGWENYLVPWGLTKPANPVTLTSNLGSTATLTLNDVRNGGPHFWTAKRTTLLGDGNGNLMDGHVNATDDPYDGTCKFDMVVSDIPFASYDVIVYMGFNPGQYGDGTAKIIFNGGAEQDVTVMGPAVFDGTFTEIVDAVTPGNYIVFEGVTGSSFTMQMWGNGFNHIGPYGFQIGVPEPASLALLGLGGLAMLRRRRNGGAK